MSSVELIPVAAARPVSKWPLLAAAAGLIWAFWPTFDFMVEKWISDPQYSHGFLVPFFSAYLLLRRLAPEKLKDTQGLFLPLFVAAYSIFQSSDPDNRTSCTSRPWPIIGGIILAAMVALRALAGGLLFHQLDTLALFGSLAALAVAFGGTRLLKLTAPALLFLIFMVPLPYELEKNVGGPLKIVATWASTFLLQTLGYPAVAEGNIILIDEVRLGVVDACSGLKMLMTFSAFAFGAVLLLDRTPFEKLLIVLGIVPIAVVTNVLRIVATGIAHTLTPDKAEQNLVHDINGWLMMPLGLALLAFQLWCLSRLVIRPSADVPDGESTGYGHGMRPALA